MFDSKFTKFFLLGWAMLGNKGGASEYLSQNSVSIFPLITTNTESAGTRVPVREISESKKDQSRRGRIVRTPDNQTLEEKVKMLEITCWQFFNIIGNIGYEIRGIAEKIEKTQTLVSVLAENTENLKEKIIRLTKTVNYNSEKLEKNEKKIKNIEDDVDSD